jgi:hypothetical protein
MAGILCGCHSLPDDDTLTRNFLLHRATFDRLLSLAAEDFQYNRISAGTVPPIGMTAQRFKRYSELFRDLHIENGITRYAAFPRAVFVIADSEIPIGGKGQSDGYVYSPAPLAPLVARLPPDPLIEVRRGHGHSGGFRHLEGGWYLFGDSDW